ncbi:hypothetical protein ATANTOWER_026203, partial [Ataeniobius toweri]|nr:hypothetical protein [Ataeniobius toweri]
EQKFMNLNMFRHSNQYLDLRVKIWTKDPEESWHLVCPPGDKDTESKLWLKTSLKNLNKDLKYFHWFLRTGNQTKDGFKPIRKSRLQHADRLDTVDLMLQMYPTDFKKVTQKIMKKINTSKENEVLSWVVNNLDNVDDRELKYFHWFLKTADKSKDGFKPIKNSHLEDADRLDTANLMVQTYTTNSKEVTKMILNKIKSNKGKVIPEAEEQMKPSSPAAAEEKELSKVLDQFVKKAPKETLTQLSQALVADGVLKSSEKETIVEKNHTRMNRASCLADTVMDKGPGAYPSECRRNRRNAGARFDLKRWLKKTLEELKTKDLRYFHFYLRTADESKDGFKPIKRIRLTYADRLDTLDLLVNLYPAKVKEVTEKVLEKMSSNTAQHLVLEAFDEMGDEDLKYCQMILQSTDKLMGSITPTRKAPMEDGEEVDTVKQMMQMYNLENREELEKALNKIQEHTNDLSEAGDQDNPPSSAALGEKKMKNMLLDFIKKVSNETLEQLLKDLVADKVLTASEGKSVVEQNHTRVNKASCLVEILKEKGSETCQKVLNHLQTIDPQLFSKLGLSQIPPLKQELFQLLSLKLKEENKMKEGGTDEEEKMEAKGEDQ